MKTAESIQEVVGAVATGRAYFDNGGSGESLEKVTSHNPENGWTITEQSAPGGYMTLGEWNFQIEE